MKNIQKYLMLGIFVLVFTLLVINLVYAEMVMSDAGVEYESDIIDAFNNQTLAQEMLNESGIEILKIENTQTWIRVMVRLKDDSGTMPTEISEREEWFKPRVEEVLNSLSEEEIKTYANLSDGFSAFITKQGFEKIINNDAIRRVHWLREEVKLFRNDFNINNLYAYIGVILIVLIIIWTILKLRKIKIKIFNKIFIGLILIELVILLIIVFLLSPVTYSTPCQMRDYSLLDPFNTFKTEGVCIQMLAIGINPLFYPFTDLLILTIIVYIICLIKKSKRKN